MKIGALILLVGFAAGSHTSSAQINDSKTADSLYQYHKDIHKEILGSTVHEVLNILLLTEELYNKVRVDSNGCEGIYVKHPDGTYLFLWTKKIGCAVYACVKDEIVIGFAWRLGFRNLKQRGKTYRKCTIGQKRQLIRRAKRAKTSAEIPGHL